MEKEPQRPLQPSEASSFPRIEGSRPPHCYVRATVGLTPREHKGVLTLLGKSKTRGKAVSSTMFGGQKDQVYLSGETHSHGGGDEPHRLHQQVGRGHVWLDKVGFASHRCHGNRGEGCTAGTKVVDTS